MEGVVHLADEPDRALNAAAEALRTGQAVIFPTDTVYGLAALPSVPGAVANLAAIKGRAATQPIAALVADVDQALGLLQPVPAEFEPLARAFWPGGLTLIGPSSSPLAVELGGDGTTVGVRCPAHDFARALAEAVGPIAATSVNPTGEAPIQTAADAAAFVHQSAAGHHVAVIVDGGPGGGTASTVVSLVGPDPVVLREGDLSEAELRAVLQP